MARIRTIKPDFFTSEDITERTPLARLLYVALWCEADREGRLVWKPKTFKLRYLPADECDIEQLCEELIQAGLVVPYGDGLAFIPTFGDHQHLNPREAASTLAPPNASATRRSRVKHASPPVPDAQVGREGKGREGEGKEGKEDQMSSASPSTDLLGANPPADLTQRRAERLAVVTDDAIEAYNRILAKPDGLLKAVRPSVGKDTRRAQVRRCLKTAAEICQDQFGDSRITPEFWEAYFAAASEDPFTAGRGPYNPPHQNWRPDFDYLTKRETMLKLFDRAVDSDETGVAA